MFVAAKFVPANGVLALVETLRVQDPTKLPEQPPAPELASAELDLRGLLFGGLVMEAGILSSTKLIS